MSLLELMWTDVLIPHVLTHLSLKDCFNLRCVSKGSRSLVDMHFKNLKTLKLINRNDFPKKSFKVLFVCEKLKTLNLSRCNFLTDDLLLPLVNNNKGLTDVNLGRCENITAKSLQPIILNKVCEIKALNLARCSWFTTGAIETLTVHQSSLEEVDLSYSNFLSDGCLVLFLKRFRNIRVLSLEGVAQVSDQCMLAISKFLINLQHLNVANCHNVTDTGISYLAKNCTNLETLAVRLCAHVTEKSLSTMRKRNILVDRKRKSILYVTIIE